MASTPDLHLLAVYGLGPPLKLTCLIPGKVCASLQLYHDSVTLQSNERLVIEFSVNVYLFG